VSRNLKETAMAKANKSKVPEGMAPVPLLLSVRLDEHDILWCILRLPDQKPEEGKVICSVAKGVFTNPDGTRNEERWQRFLAIMKEAQADAVEAALGTRPGVGVEYHADTARAEREALEGVRGVMTASERAMPGVGRKPAD
jgi:hypothetical protein